MNTLKNRAPAFGVFAILVGSLLLSGPFQGSSQAQKAAPVTVVNTTAQPVPVTGSLAVLAQQSGVWSVNLDEFAQREPIQFSIQANLAISEGAATRTFTVPAGQRLVIEHISCSAAVPVGQKAMCHFITTAGSAEAFHLLVMVEQGLFVGNEQFRATQAIRAYADPETLVRLVGQRNDGSGTAIFDFTLSGYLVAVP